MIGAKQRRAVASALVAARQNTAPIDPITETIPGFDVDDAYAVQSMVIDARRQAGASVVGWKVGLTSEAMRQQLGVDEPDFGPLLDDMSLTPGDAVKTRSLIAPRVEAEIAFRLRTAVAAPVLELDDFLDAVGEVIPALEVIDSRIVDWRINLPDTIADHASCASFVLGEPLLFTADLDLESLGVSLYEDDTECAAGLGAAVLGNPLRAISWLANTLAAYGESLLPGQVILAGALHASIGLRPSTTVTARFTDARLGDLSIDCV